jgi:hypothetical protein
MSNPVLKPYHPKTFRERGVAVPFTTPRLGGTRARQTDTDGVELVIPNPSGGRGVYIMPWKAIRNWCTPTLHDAVLNDRIAAMDDLTPAAVRRVGLAIAADGLAGEQACEAAHAAMVAERNDTVATHHRLLVTLMEQVRSRLSAPDFAALPEKPNLMAQTRLAAEWISPRLGQTPSWTISALDAIAEVLLNVGTDPAGTAARLPRILSMLHQVRAAIFLWNSKQRDDDYTDYASMVCAMIDLTLSLASATLGQAQALTDDMVDLLRKWAADPPAISALAMRPEWLLDGWEQICLVWNNARDDAEQRAALVEIIGQIPVVPLEAAGWTDTASDLDSALGFRRLISLNEDWRSGSIVFQLIARNERFRAITCHSQ